MTDPAALHNAAPAPDAAGRRWRAALELLASMRFAISLLTLICIASVIGTVLKQQEPLGNYINQFGPFWAEVFGKFGLYAVYSAWWFLLILAFLVLSTSLCIARNTPKILVDLRVFKENIRVQSLQAFGHRAQGTLAAAPPEAAQRMAQYLSARGWKVRLQPRTHEGGVMLAAKTGAANKWGYIAAHSAIVLICLGGLLDGDLIVRAQMVLGGKTPYQGGGLIADVAPEHRLDARNPTFRGNLLVAEGTQSSTAILNQSDGIVLQELPFAIELKKFIVEHYSTGMPKLFASEIVIHDKATGEKLERRVEVNHPVQYQGVEIYQSSFDDGGSRLRVQSLPLQAQARPLEIEGVVGGATRLGSSQGELTLEFTGLRVFNIENFANSSSAVDVRSVDLRAALDSRMGAANKADGKKDLRNVGPSFSYKLRDAAGQAREFNNYMLPVDMGDGVPVFLLGVRESPAEPFRYLRVPPDELGGLSGFFRLRAALGDAALRTQAVQRYVSRTLGAGKPELAAQLRNTAQHVLALYAGAPTREAGQPSVAGLQAVSDFLEQQVPAEQRDRAGEMMIRLLSGVLFDLHQVARTQARLAPLTPDEATQRFMTQAVLSLSDALIYPAPLAFELKDFTQVQASVFQVARAPGKKVVYLGCAFLILGVFAMLYVRERRLWVWLAAAGTGTHATLAWSCNRKTLDGDHAFEHIRDQLLPGKE